MTQRTFRSITDMIGHTPLLKLERLAPGWQVYAKCEFKNPMSLKDRAVRQIIADAEAEGRLSPGSTLIECTSGNTGSIAAAKRYRAILVMSEIQSLERRMVLRALGAELVLTPASEGTVGARRRLQEICTEHPEYYYVGQHVNPSNPRAHELTTGPEIWDDTGGAVDVLVAALGTGGTLCGAGRFLRQRKPGIHLVAVEPAESPTISQGLFRPHRMMGTAPGFVPETLDRAYVDEFSLVSEAEAFAMCRRIARQEGLLVGISSGATAHAALEIAKRSEGEAMIVCVFADTGERYLSVKGLFDVQETVGAP
jgi:cysteine synthase A